MRCLAQGQGHNTVPPVRLKPTTPQSRVKYSTTESPRSSIQEWKLLMALPQTDLWGFQQWQIDGARELLQSFWHSEQMSGGIPGTLV